MNFREISVIKPLLSITATVMVLAGCRTAPHEPVVEFAQPLPPGVERISVSSADESGVYIAHQKYQLANGLTVILHPDRSDPLVHVDVTYHVGSAREEPGKSGFAHFFEHMMFQGSKHVADDEHLRLITEAGGNMNGTTNTDRTNYYQTVPANQLEKVLWLEADRMGFLLDAVDQRKFENQRETVKNERAQNYDNQPYGLRSERVSEALYPIGHPYSWSTIGYVEDLDRVTVDDLKAFFLRWYGPNNAVLTIGGDIDVNQTLAWVHQYFASIPEGPAVERMPKTPVTLEADRYVTLEDEVHLPLVQFTYPTVHVRHEDEAPLDVLSDILGGGKTSLFYKNLVRGNHAVQALVSHPCRELACEFQMIALANPAKTADLATLAQRMQATLDEFEQRGVQPDDLNRTKAHIEASSIYSLQSVAGKVSTLASNELFSDTPDMVGYDLNRYNAVSAEDVMRVYRKYIKGKAKVVLSIVPMGQVQLAVSEQNFQLPARQFEISKVTQEVPAPIINDNFDRRQMPSSGPIPQVTVPEFWQETLLSGVEVIGHTSNETPTISLVLSMEGGPLLDPADKAGLAALTADMMDESTELMSNTEMANALALLGSQISFSAAGRFTQIRVSSLTENLDKTLELLEQKLTRPAFSDADFQSLKTRLLQAMQQRAKDPSAMAGRAVSRVMYGEDSRISLPDIGTLETARNITLDDVKNFYQSYYSPQHANLVYVGNISRAALINKLDFLARWEGPEYRVPAVSVPVIEQQPGIFIVDKPGAPQSVVRIFRPAAPYDATGIHFKSKLMNFPFGGMFNSRINLNLREDKGYTYGASSSFIGGKSLGRFMIATDINQQNTVAGLSELLEELQRYHAQGMTEQELQIMRSAYSQSEALRYETPYSKSTFLRNMLVFELPIGYLREQHEIIRSISREELNLLADVWLNPDEMQIVVVGDAATLKEALAKFGRPITELNIAM